MTAPTRYEDFTEPGARPWLDLPGAEAEIARRVEAGELSPERGEMLRNWREQGWLVLDIQLEDELLDPHRLEMDALVDRHRSEPVDTWKVKLQNMYVDSEAARTLMREPRLLEWVDLILGRRCQPYQTLSLPVGSQIGPHSDQILMTTYPEGHMVAAWIALEDIEPDSGPLMLWTGSHKLPYLSAQVVGLPEGGSEGERAVAYDRLYYEACRARIAEHRFEPYHFVPKKGQVLLWHSNVLHGGAPVTGDDTSRRSLVVHYYSEDVHHYSDLFDRPCDLPGLRP